MNNLLSFCISHVDKERIKESITQALKPRMYCFICRTRNHTVVCQACLNHLTTLNTACRSCALPLLDTTDQLCGQCIQAPPALDAILTAYAYSPPLRHLIHHFKYHEGYFLTQTLTKLLLNALPPDYTTDCIVPVPMHTKRLKQRGFHHTLWLARAVARHVPFPIEEHLCQKIIHTSNSAKLNAKERQTANSKAYWVAPTEYQHVTLLDDLTTTRETGNTLARLFKANGVKKVVLWCCARTL